MKHPLVVASLLSFTPLAHANTVGHWQIDPTGWPSFSISAANHMKQQQHLFGNSRINAVTNQQGATQLFVANRAFAYFGRQYGGGYSYIVPKNKTQATQWQANFPTLQKQQFGINYADRQSQLGALQVKHHIYAPTNQTSLAADPNYLIDALTLSNSSKQTLTFDHYEIWDASYFPVSSPVQWFRPNEKNSDLGWITRAQELARIAFSLSFHPQIDRSQNGIRVSRAWAGNDPLPAEKQINANNYFVPTIALQSDAADSKFIAISNKAALTTLPTAALQTFFKDLMAPVLLVKTPITLAAHQQKTLYFRYGLTNSAGNMPLIYDHMPAPKVTAMPNSKPPELPSEKAQVLQREFLWKIGQLQSWSLYRSYYDRFAIPQGSVYTYLQGFDGASRDLLQMVPILSITQPTLGKQMLEMVMSLQQSQPKTGQGAGNLTYGLHGYGCAGDKSCQTAIPINNGLRSDLDLYFLWAFDAYAQQTAPTTLAKWLTSSAVKYYPQTALPPKGVTDYTPLSHLKIAIQHLIESVGVGPHGLIRVRDGDWNDGILNISEYDGHPIDEAASIAHGESIVVSQMAVSILPQIAERLRPYDPALAEKTLEFVRSLAAPLRQVWLHHTNGDWFARAYVVDKSGQPQLLGDRYIDLEAQVWALQNDNFVKFGILSREQQIKLLQTIHDQLDAPSKIGATIWPTNTRVPIPAKDGLAMTDKLSWSSIRQLLTLAYAQFPETRTYAWQALYRTSFAHHAEVFPNVWSGQLSGPDGWNITDGRSWDFIAVVQEQFPYANSNPNAMWSWAYYNLTKPNHS